MIFTPDDDFYDSVDLWDLPDCAVALLTRAGAWSARNADRGFVPKSMVARFKREAREQDEKQNAADETAAQLTQDESGTDRCRPASWEEE